ncbi:hypothetical protein [Microbispora sp. NBRC 16548]|uniref:hypothetical protein n=1 Tax=Microbispora sp. NBRC 16548 TaxID=3030994 RepID=UPI0025577DA0|nr:hypothetical protein [Microbispora sp. NBRC 16548]
MLDKARAVVEGYAEPVTLRQVFYRLVAASVIPNTVSSYKRLSALTAGARRAGTFPDLADHGRRIARPLSFTDVTDARAWLRQVYRRDRTAGQPAAIYLGVEKDALVAQLAAWYDEFGLPVVALRGYGSQTIADLVRRDAQRAGRPANLLYAGDFDSSGEDIERDFVVRTGCWMHTERVALTADQIAQFDLPPQPGKATDSRAAAFTAAHGRLVQVEVDALAPDDLHRLFNLALARWWDRGAYEAVLESEQRDLDQLDER